MGTITKTVCDFCGDEVIACNSFQTEAHIEGRFTRVGFKLIPILPDESPVKHIDLCVKCRNKVLFEWTDEIIKGLKI